MSQETQDMIKMALVSAVTGLIAWIGVSGRKAIRNYGKSNAQIAHEELVAAQAKVEAARATPEPEDDKAAEAKAQEAAEHLSSAKKFQAITDSFGEDSKSE